MDWEYAAKMETFGIDLRFLGLVATNDHFMLMISRT